MRGGVGAEAEEAFLLLRDNQSVLGAKVEYVVVDTPWAPVLEHGVRFGSGKKQGINLG